MCSYEQYPSLFAPYLKRALFQWLLSICPSQAYCCFFISNLCIGLVSSHQDKFVFIKWHLAWNPLIMTPCPLPLGMMTVSPLCALHDLVVVWKCLNIHSSCPNMMSGFSSSAFLTLSQPMNLVSLCFLLKYVTGINMQLNYAVPLVIVILVATILWDDFFSFNSNASNKGIWIQ